MSNPVYGKKATASRTRGILTTQLDSLHVTAWYVAHHIFDWYFRQCASTYRFRHRQEFKQHEGLAPPLTGPSPARRCMFSWARA